MEICFCGSNWIANLGFPFAERIKFFISYLSIVICQSSFVIGMEEIVSQANELENRLIDFAVRIIKWANALPDSPAAKHIAKQLAENDLSS